MELFELNTASTLSGIAAVLSIAFLRFQWPFRYRYIGLLHRNDPDRMIKWLERSYSRNRVRTVAMLDKSASEILSGRYDDAEKYVLEGLSVCHENPTLFHRVILQSLFYNLSIIYFYRGNYREAIEVALRLYEGDRHMTHALVIAVCSFARLGDISSAIDAMRLIPPKHRRKHLKLFCSAEIEAAKGNYLLALHHMKELRALPYSPYLYLTPIQIDKRIEEITKASSRAG